MVGEAPGELGALRFMGRVKREWWIIGNVAYCLQSGTNTGTCLGSWSFLSHKVLLGIIRASGKCWYV